MTRVMCYNLSTGHNEVVDEIDWPHTDFYQSLEIQIGEAEADWFQALDCASDHVYYASWSVR